MMKKYIQQTSSSVPVLFFLIGVFLSIGLATGYKSLAADGTISGVAFQDMNRNGLMDAGEAPLVGKQIYALDYSKGTQYHASTDASGRYIIVGVPAGTYEVSYDSSAWWEIWNDWAPSTNNSWVPKLTLQTTDASPSATINWGWRPIVKSTDEKA